MKMEIIGGSVCDGYISEKIGFTRFLSDDDIRILSLCDTKNYINCMFAFVNNVNKERSN